MQEALSIVVRYKGYEVLSPDDLSERLMKEDDLAEAFVSLAASQGLMGPDRTAPYDEGMEGAALIGEKLGADLLVLAYGQGEYHSAGENLVQGIVTGLVEQFLDQAQGTGWLGGQMAGHFLGFFLASAAHSRHNTSAWHAVYAPVIDTYDSDRETKWFET